MSRTLLLVHRIPYPPNKGDKIRSFHLFEYLVGHGDIYLGAFIDEPGDWKWRQVLESRCAGLCLRPLSGARATIGSCASLASGEPLSLGYYRDRRMQAWVDRVLREARPDMICVFSSVMAQYVEQANVAGAPRVIDFVDVDSDKWRQYADRVSWPLSWVYRREARLLRNYEARIANDFDASFFVSRAEAEFFRNRVRSAAAKIDYYTNGVDSRHYSPDARLESPYGSSGRTLVFTGHMSYRPNVDAVKWFVEEIWGRVRDRYPDAVFYIVGARPSREVRQLGETDGVTVTGEVDDVRPYLAHAWLAVAPMQIARGIQNKVLEAMAMAKPVVVTPSAIEGIDLCKGTLTRVAAEPRAFADACCEMLAGEVPPDDRAARDCIVTHYDWQKVFGRLGKRLWMDSSRVDVLGGCV